MNCHIFHLKQTIFDAIKLAFRTNISGSTQVTACNRKNRAVLESFLPQRNLEIPPCVLNCDLKSNKTLFTLTFYFYIFKMTRFLI